jgi:pSer/pThr/pTyr-binding forkhead associated (FHA) protein
VTGSNFTSPPLNGNTGGLTIPLRTSGVPDGKYTVVVRVLAKNNNVYSTTTYEGVTYKAPTLFQRLGVALIAAPIFLFAILAVIVAVMLFLMFTASRQKVMSGTPVMQGQLGGKLKGSGKAAGPVIPVSNDEPVLSRGRAAATPSASAPVSSPAPYLPPKPQPVSAPPSTAEATLISGVAQPDSGATVISSTPVAQIATITVVQAGGGISMPSPIRVDKFPFVIGRTEGSLILPDPNISRRHAQVDFDASRRGYVIADLNSSNGTFVNNQRLTPNQPVLLASGTVIRFGPNVTIRFDLR